MAGGGVAVEVAPAVALRTPFKICVFTAPACAVGVLLGPLRLVLECV